MKVALCLSGHVRTFEEAFPSLKKHIIDVLEPDVFMHIWDSWGEWKSLRTERFKDATDEKLPGHIERRIRELYKPRTLVIEPMLTLEGSQYLRRRHPSNKPSNVLGMYYKMKACNELKKAYEKDNGFTYDVVIRCRPDIELLADIDQEAFKTIDDHLYIPRGSNFSGVNDQFAFSNSRNMDTYSDLYDHIEEYWNAGCLFNPEMLMERHVEDQRLSVKRNEFPYYLVRMNGERKGIEDDSMWPSKTWVVPLPGNALLNRIGIFSPLLGRWDKTAFARILQHMQEGGLHPLDRIIFIADVNPARQPSILRKMTDTFERLDVRVGSFRLITAEGGADSVPAATESTMKRLDDLGKKAEVVDYSPGT